MAMNVGTGGIGREPDVTIQLDSRGVSRHHARILVSGGSAILEDLESKNGTHVNGRRITAPIHLSDGDVIGLGSASLTFRVASLTSPTETVAPRGEK